MTSHRNHNFQFSVWFNDKRQNACSQGLCLEQIWITENFWQESLFLRFTTFHFTLSTFVTDLHAACT